MLESMLRRRRAARRAAGNVGRPVVDTVTRPAVRRARRRAVQPQLHWSRLAPPRRRRDPQPAPDHLDWHGCFEAYAAAKAQIWRGAGTVAIGNADDPGSPRRLPGRARAAGLGFTLGAPGAGQLGWSAACWSTARSATGRAGRRRRRAPGRPPHNVANALAAAALARPYGVPATAVRAGLRTSVPARTAIELVAEVAGIR